MKTELLDLSLVGARRLGATVIRAQTIKPSRLAPTLPFGRNRPKLCFQSERSIYVAYHASFETAIQENNRTFSVHSRCEMHLNTGQVTRLQPRQMSGVFRTILFYNTHNKKLPHYSSKIDSPIFIGNRRFYFAAINLAVMIRYKDVTMEDQEVTVQIQKLEDERTQLRQELASLRELFKSEVDGDIGAGDPKMAERDRVRALITFKQRKLNAIEQALAEAQQGLYGICERCGQPIDPDRLEAVPDATLCIDCQRIAERRGQR